MDRTQVKCYSILPAAGRSHRMGQPKLLLPWPSPKSGRQLPTGWTVFDSVVSAWEKSKVDHIVIVLEQDRNLDRQQIQVNDKARSLADGQRVLLAYADQPADMKASIIYGLSFLESRFKPTGLDLCFAGPSDVPLISTDLINGMLEQSDKIDRAAIPLFAGEPGHPPLFRWEYLQQVKLLADNQGINQLLSNDTSTKVEFPSLKKPGDIDTMQDYRKELEKLERTPNGMPTFPASDILLE